MEMLLICSYMRQLDFNYRTDI